MVLDREPRAFLAAEDDLALDQQIADVLEAHARLVHFNAVLLRHGIDQMRRGDGTRRAAFPAAAAAEVVQQQGQHLVGINVRAVGVDDAKAVRIAVNSQADIVLSLFHDRRKICEILFRRLRGPASEERVAMTVENGYRAARVPKNGIEIIPPRAVEQVHGDLELRLSDRFEVDLLSQVIKVGFAQVRVLDKALFPGLRERHHRDGRVLFKQSVCPRLNIFCRIRQRRAAPGRRELEAVVFGRIVACREIDAAAGFTPDDLIGNDGRRNIPVGEEGAYPVRSQDHNGLRCESLGQEAGVVADNHAFVLQSLRGKMVGDRLRHHPHPVEREIVGDHSTPARRPEFYLHVRHTVNKYHKKFSNAT